MILVSVNGFFWKVNAMKKMSVRLSVFFVLVFWGLVLGGLADAGGDREKEVDDLFAIIRSGDREGAKQAVNDLGNLIVLNRGAREAFFKREDEIFKMIGDQEQSGYVRRTLLPVMVNLKFRFSDKRVKELRGMMHDRAEHWDVRGTIVMCLGSICKDQTVVVDDCIVLLGSTNKNLRISAAQALNSMRLGNADLFKICQVKLIDTSAHVRRTGMQDAGAMVYQKDRRGLLFLLRGLSDRDDMVKKEAVRFLKLVKIKGIEKRVIDDTMIKMLSSKDHGVVVSVSLYFLNESGDKRRKASVKKDILRWLWAGQKAEVRLWTIRGLQLYPESVLVFKDQLMGILGSSKVSDELRLNAGAALYLAGLKSEKIKEAFLSLVDAKDKGVAGMARYYLLRIRVSGEGGIKD